MQQVHRNSQSSKEIRSFVSREYYQADSYSIHEKGQSHQLDFQLSTAQAGIVPINRFRGEEIGVRRTWQHIRAAPCCRYVIWFPIDGSMSVTQDLARAVRVSKGQLVITSGDRPFHIQMHGGTANEAPSQLHILVPAHLMHSQMPLIDRMCGHVIDASSGSGALAFQIFNAIFQDSDDFSEDAAEKLSLGALKVITDILREKVAKEVDLDDRKTQLKRVLTFIRKNLAIQGLTLEDVASGCNVSRRYIHYLLSENDMHFGEVLWGWRLDQAHEWLGSPDFKNFNLIDIAYMAGFRSASHFSKTYRGRYGCSPMRARSDLKLAN